MILMTTDITSSSKSCCLVKIVVHFQAGIVEMPEYLVNVLKPEMFLHQQIKEIFKQKLYICLLRIIA